MRKILVPIRGDGKGEGLLDHAILLARRLGAHIEAIHSRPRGEDMLPQGMFVPPALREQLRDSARGYRQQEGARLRSLFDDYVTKAGVEVIEADTVPPVDRPSLSWVEEIGKQRDVVAACGCLADLIVVSRPDHDTGLGTGTIEAALMTAGRLMLLCPPTSPTVLGERVSIGWNGSAEGGRAVTAALPILARATAVTIFCEDAEQSVSTGALALRDYLSLHAIDAGIEVLDMQPSVVAQALLRAASENASDTLLIGAYGQRSRRRELVMGGVTQHIIDHADMPVLMMH